ncbi:diacylglycerol kinase family protein [Paucilactobacillus suebicus]|uniref:DAGKc domain-containing protein n=1 Tax=Paucilactobacillus suebicus DSM 5007 = KCTC 3549 TaxID=1423807 RepID=A0A0R1W2B6_9LACO|nr:diacylglycerol kinase family protein [Paucilactobacillus suebicus]KRM09673.1 hypothetical protein FD16_GL001594 [Paucilactobacillus suebicus DSM 5007 = KCTC 3549]
MGQRYGIYYNDHAGQGQANCNVHQVERQLREHGMATELMTATSTDAAVELVSSKLSGLDGLVVVGGDGTLNVAVTAMLHRKLTVPLGLVPCGRVNNFARQWGIPTDLDQAMEVIFQNNLQRIGIGNCNGNRAIVSYMGFGNLSDLANDMRQRQSKSLTNRMAYFMSALRRTGHHQSYEITYQLDERPTETHKTWVALLTTNPPAKRQYLSVQPLRFSLSVLNDIHRRQVIPYVYFAWSGKMHHSDAVTYMTPKTLKIQNVDGKQVRTRIDGDVGPKLPIEVSYCPRVLPIFLTAE